MATFGTWGYWSPPLEMGHHLVWMSACVVRAAFGSVDGAALGSTDGADDGAIFGTTDGATVGVVIVDSVGCCCKADVVVGVAVRFTDGADVGSSD